jgi:hypothetical protein
MGELGHVSTSDELERMVIEKHAVSLNCTIGSESVCVVWSSRIELYRAIRAKINNLALELLTGRRSGFFEKCMLGLPLPDPRCFKHFLTLYPPRPSAVILFLSHLRSCSKPK